MIMDECFKLAKLILLENFNKAVGQKSKEPN